jgi:MFS family permease
MFINLSPLIRHRNYRLLFIGQSVSFLGSMVSYVAVPYQVFKLTNSTFLVGLLGAVQLIPLGVFGLLGGSIADRIDRRRLLIASESVMCLAALLLAANACLPSPNVGAIFILVFLMQSAQAYHRPAMEAMSQKIVDPTEYAAIGALGSLRYSTGAIVGPAIGGILLSAYGVAAAYIFDVMTFLVALVSVCFISESYKAEQLAAGKSLAQDIREGLAFALTKQSLLGTYIVDIAAMTFAFPLALFPALAPRWGDEKILGWLYAAMAIGSLVVSLLSGRAGRVRSHGKMVVIAAASWGVAIVGFGLARTFIWAMIFLILAGAADMISGLYRGIIWNETIPNNMRGRLAGIEMISYMSGPLLGNFRAGTLASWTSLEFSIASGGMICVVAVFASAWALPGFWSYRKALSPQD